MSDSPEKSRRKSLIRSSLRQDDLSQVEGSSTSGLELTVANSSTLPRHRSTHSRPTTPIHESHKDQPFNTVSLLDTAAEEQDFDAIKEGLKFALGTSGEDSHWFPSNTHHDDEEDREHDTSADAGDDTSLLNRHYGNHLQVNTDHLNVPDTPFSNRTFFSHASKDLESGMPPPAITVSHDNSQSPAKISNIIHRVSDRIAGTGGAALPETSGAKTPDSHSMHSSSNLPSPSIHSAASGDDNSHSDYFSSRLNVLDIQSHGTGAKPRVSSVTDEVPEVSFHESTFAGTSSIKEFPYKDNYSMYLFGNSLKLFSPQNRYRQMCHKLVSHKMTNTLLLVLLVAQTVLLSYLQWNPSKNKGYITHGFSAGEYVLIPINVIYTIEMLARIIAYGLYDDRIMYEELNIPYPENPVTKRLFAGSWIDSLRKTAYAIIFPATGKRKKHTFTDAYKDGFGESTDSNEIEMEDTTNHIHSKYSGYNDTTDDANLTNQPILPSQRLRTENTFFKHPKNGDISKLHLRRAYLRNSWHRIDHISIITYWLSLLLSIDRYDVHNHIAIFRALSCLRILRLCNLTRGTSMILESLKVAVPQLVDVSLFIGCFGIFFGIIGVQSFKSSLRRHCVWYNPDDSSEKWVNDDQKCGGYLSTADKARPYLLASGHSSSSIKGFRCPVNSKCETLENPSSGTVSFDNFFHSLELVFVIMSANTFTDLMYDTMDSDDLVACLYFICCLFIMTVWLLNVFIAIIVSCFNSTRLSSENEIRSRGRLNIFGKGNQPISMHKVQLDKLRGENWRLNWYYKLEPLFTVAIILDLVVQCTRRYDESRSSDHSLYRVESAFTALFACEIAIRFFCYMPDWRNFFRFKRNCFDLFLALITVIIIISPIKKKLGHAYYWLTAFQILRCYRVVLISSFTRDLWLKIMGNLKQMLDLSLFFFLLLYLTSIIFSRFFEGSISPEEIDDEGIDFSFQTLPNTFVGLYTITSTENWTDILYPLQGYQKSGSAKCFAAILLIMWFIISNMVILNIFIAVIANTLVVPETEKRRMQLLQFIENITTSIHSVENESGALAKFKNKFLNRKGMREELQLAVVNLLLSGTAVNDFLDKEDSNLDNDATAMLNLPTNKFKRWWVINYKRFTNAFNNPFHTHKHKAVSIAQFDPTNYAKGILSERNKLIESQNRFLKENPSYNKVFYIIGPRHKLRRFCQRIVTSNHGERINGVEPNKRVSELFAILMFISTLGLVITACYLTPLYRANLGVAKSRSDWPFWLDLGFIGIFTIEFLIRVLADGLIFTPNAYCRSSWNIIDCIVLISLWIEFIAYLKNDGNLSRAIRGFKALRALRILTISETAKNNFHHTIISGFGKIINAGFMSLCLLIPFSIWGLNIFNGRLGYCLDGTSTQGECMNEFNAEVFGWEVVSPNVYTNPYLQFNDFPHSFSSLFEITSLEGWVDLLNNVMASTGVGTVPQPFYSPFNGFFVILFNFVGIVLILTLFISVIIHNYSLTTGRGYMTNEQMSWYQVKKFLSQVTPSRRQFQGSTNPIRRFCYKLTVEKDKTWSAILNFVLLLHVIALLVEMYPSHSPVDTTRMIVYLVASVLFTVNGLMLLVARGFKTFFMYKWSIFNIFVSFGALLTTIIGIFVSNESVFININKLFLVATMVFVIPRSDRLSQFLRFASASLPSLFSLLFTWLVLFLLFAIALNQIFGTTKIGANGTHNLNVRTVPKALIMLFRCSFGEGWNYIMDDYKLAHPYCSADTNSTNTDCGNKQYAYILFIAWNIISMYIFLNMFISLILDSFSYIMSKGEYETLIERKEIRKFKRSWQKYDPEGTGYISPKDLPKLLKSLDGALSFHFYHGSLEIPVLCHKWFRRNNPANPYDITVNYSEIENSFQSWDVEKIRERRQAYELFMEEAILNMEINGEPGISFKRVLLQLPLYKSFDASTCLNLIDYLDRTLLLQKVRKRLNQNKVYETITAYTVRWKYMKNKRMGIKTNTEDIDIDTELRRRSYLSGDRSPMSREYLDDAFERDFGLKVDDEEVDKAGEKSPASPKTGLYVPKSPLNINKKSKSPLIGKLSPPKLFVQIPEVPKFHVSGVNSSISSFEKDSSDSPSESTQGLLIDPFNDKK